MIFLCVCGEMDALSKTRGWKCLKIRNRSRVQRVKSFSVTEISFKFVAFFSQIWPFQWCRRHTIAPSADRKCRENCKFAENCSKMEAETSKWSEKVRLKMWPDWQVSPHEWEESKLPRFIYLEIVSLQNLKFRVPTKRAISRGGWVSGGCWQNKGKSVKFYCKKGHTFCKKTIFFLLKRSVFY